MFYIYHVPGVKIGCSENPNRRVFEQGYTEYEILETHDCVDTASRREIELQQEYEYGRDTSSTYLETILFQQKGQTKEANRKRSSKLIGHKKSEETRAKLSKAHTGKTISDKHKSNISVTLRKLTDKAEEIRELYSTGNYSYSKIAEIYGVGAMTICRIVKRTHGY